MLLQALTTRRGEDEREQPVCTVGRGFVSKEISNKGLPKKCVAYYWFDEKSKEIVRNLAFLLSNRESCEHIKTYCTWDEKKVLNHGTSQSGRKQHGRPSSDITNVSFLSRRVMEEERGRSAPTAPLQLPRQPGQESRVPCMFCMHTLCALMMGPQMNKEQFCCCSAFFAHKLSIHSIYSVLYELCLRGQALFHVG